MKQKIIIIDDDIQWINEFKHLIGDNYHFVTATNVKDALKAVIKEHNLKLVIMDFMLPLNRNEAPRDIEGINLIGKIQKKYPNLPIIVASAYMQAYENDLKNYGILAFINKEKPFKRDSIKYYINKALNKSKIKIRKYLKKPILIPELRKIASDEFEEHSSIKEKRIYIPQEGYYELIKPLIGFKKDIEKQITNFPFSKNVFLMMKFRDANKEISDYIMENLSNHGLLGVRADDDEWSITRNVYNPIAVLYCCKYGIALFDEPEKGQGYSPNVAYELGMMHYQNKNCLILRHKSLPDMPFNLIKDLYMTYDRDLQVKQKIESWIKRL